MKEMQQSGQNSLGDLSGIANEMDEVMRLHGYSYGEDWITKKIEGAGHYPKEWRKRLDMPLTLLLSKD